MREKIKAVMMGHAVADALGVPVEFLSRGTLRENPVVNMRGYGTYPYPEGCWSDDTSMSIATLDSLLKGYLDCDDIMQKFWGWYNGNEYTPTGKTFDIGNICRFAIENHAILHQPAEKCGIGFEWANGNGSLMRIHPVCLYLYCKGESGEGAIETVNTVSALTHSHERSQMACGIYSLVLFELLKNPDKSAVYDGLRAAEKTYSQSEEYSHFSERLIKRIGRVCEETELDALGEMTEKEIKSTGYVVDSLEAAIWCLLNTDSYAECVLKAVNLGEDTDTVAAIAGSLAGALYGYDGIPKEWLEALKRREYLEEMCDRAYEVWTNGESI